MNMIRDTERPEAWSSTETWAIRKWMSGDRTIMDEWRDRVSDLLEDEILAKYRRTLRRTLAAELRRETHTHCCSLSGLASELVDAALLNVNWTQIAEATLADFANAGMAIPQDDDESIARPPDAPNNPVTEDFRENPFTFEPDHPAEGYPLTVAELKVICLHWWEKYIDTGVFCRLFGTTGGSDRWRWEYASRRIQRIETIIGDQESQMAYAEASLRFKRMLGDVVWQAYLDGKPILGDDATDEEKAYYKAEMIKVGWVFNEDRPE